VVSSTYFPNRIFVGLNYAEGPAKKINITSKLIKEVKVLPFGKKGVKVVFYLNSPVDYKWEFDGNVVLLDIKEKVEIIPSSGFESRKVVLPSPKGGEVKGGA